MRSSQIEVHGIAVEIVRKKIKNLHLRVSPAAGRVRVSAPLRVDDAVVRELVNARLDWIRDHQSRIAARPLRPRLELVSGEQVDYLEDSYCLNVCAVAGRPRAELVERTLHLLVPPGSDRAQRMAVLECWYRRQLKELIPPRLRHWERVLDVEAAEWGVKRMKTRWGTCNIGARRIWLNLALIRQPAVCLDYILVHELTHLLERGHNARFRQLMDRFLPQWRHPDALLRKCSLRDEA
ncbi:MAG: M48 family metallopeptidase [Desulfuromonadaceae bacterium]|nr:M48 family metallopeptidase [Desulfuromonadaceae bacterium]